MTFPSFKFLNTYIFFIYNIRPSYYNKITFHFMLFKNILLTIILVKILK